MMVLLALIHYLPFVPAKWLISGISWVLYIFATFLADDDIEQTNGLPAFFLAGDSTTAAQSCCGGGWGNGFLSTLHNGALGSNFGHNGATTASFLQDGDWGNVIDSVYRYSKYYTPYVTIAFGHNDQNVLPMDQFMTNYKNFALDVQAAGGYPIFVTPLSRRRYDSSGLVIEDLEVQREAVLSVAASFTAGSAFVIDLNLASRIYLDRIGQNNSLFYSLFPGDDTHLNVPGGLVFGNLVSALIVQEVRSRHGYEISSYTYPNKTIWDAIVRGEFIFPDI